MRSQSDPIRSEGRLLLPTPAPPLRETGLILAMATLLQRAPLSLSHGRKEADEDDDEDVHAVEAELAFFFFFFTSSSSACSNVRRRLSTMGRKM